MNRTPLIFLLVILLSPLTWAATLDVELAKQLEDTPPDGFVRAIVVMSKQANLRQPAETSAKLAALQQLAAQTQRGLIDILSKGMQEGRVKSYRSFWIFNGVHLIATPKVLRNLAALPEVRSILLDRLYPCPKLTDSAESETAVQRVWETFNITGKGVTVGVLGTGADLSVTDLQNTYRRENGWLDVCAGQTTPYDDAGLSTGALSALHTEIAPDVRWMAAKVMKPEGGYASWLYAGLQWVADPDGNPQTDDAPKVINVPVCKADFARDVACAKAVDNLCRLGIFCVMPLGLDVDIPADLHEVPLPVNPFAVVAVDASDEITTFGKPRPAAFHPLLSPDLSATPVVSRAGSVEAGSGDVLACIQVIGAVALLLEAAPDLTVTDLRWILKRTAVDIGEPGIDPIYGAGRLDVAAALRYVIGESDPSQNLTDVSTTLVINPQQLVIDAAAGQIGEQAFTISNPGRDSASIRIRMDTPKRWLAPEPSLLTIAPGAVEIVTVAYDTRLLDAGNYAAELVVESGGEATTIFIDLSVRAKPQEARELQGLGAAVTGRKSGADDDDDFGAFGGDLEGGDGGNDRNSDDVIDDHGDSRESGTPVSYGNESFGIIDRPGDYDYFVFDAKKDDVVTIEVNAQSIGSRLDSYIYLYGPTGRYLTRDDDGGIGFDSLISDYKIREDGRYSIRVRNFSRRRGGPDYNYILSVQK